MSVQLGGGTDIHRALAYCEILVKTRHRTIFVFVTGIYEVGSLAGMIAVIKRLREAGVRVLGLAALDQNSQPINDKDTARLCLDVRYRGGRGDAVAARRMDRRGTFVM